ncbi:hypothetical protein EYS09_15045 [Streptomyces kasugaensis]|uniref:Uncharacterized protein n=1 Tax=Streptomyces kasugaensis TaxID=1946 RepID=A0A4Q9HUS5_STRKA|nr:hypothetical protein [Streptomyces kasugaensis]TBO58894.1 hypothetical protein EYS09_15045 [Streptomyces kasugaensis]
MRAQPFTMEHWGLSLPDVDATPETARGPLDEQEQRLLSEAHRAVDNARTARWMLGFSLEVVRRRRLYRGDGTRTWEQYLTLEHDGLSTSEADRLQKSWRLAQTVQKELGRPLPDSHLRKLQPYAERTNDQEAARAYTELYWAHQAGGVRLVANQVQQRVKNAVAAAKGVSDPAERSQAISAAWTTAPEAVMPAQRGEAEREQGDTSGRRLDPVDAALQLLNTARQVVEDAAEDKAARRARSSEEAQRQQETVRRIGRILSKVKIEADANIVDGEVIVDAELVEG